MNNKYTIQFLGKTATIEVEVEYSEAGHLAKLVFPIGISREAIEYCYNRIPLDENECIDTPGIAKVLTVPQDLSFNVFWEQYAHKIGDKTRTMKLWTALTEADRIKCLRAIPKYHQWLRQRPSMERLYPETFLKQERFRNEFKI